MVIHSVGGNSLMNLSSPCSPAGGRPVPRGESRSKVRSSSRKKLRERCVPSGVVSDVEENEGGWRGRTRGNGRGEGRRLLGPATRAPAAWQMARQAYGAMGLERKGRAERRGTVGGGVVQGAVRGHARAHRVLRNAEARCKQRREDGLHIWEWDLADLVERPSHPCRPPVCRKRA